MMLPRDTVTWQAWAESPAVGKETQNRRKHVLALWAKANGRDSPQGVIDDIVLDRITPYVTMNRFLNSLRDEGLAPSTVSLYRSQLGGEGDARSGAGFFLSVIG